MPEDATAAEVPVAVEGAPVAPAVAVLGASVSPPVAPVASTEHAGPRLRKSRRKKR
jgi:hypothetical protein